MEVKGTWQGLYRIVPSARPRKMVVGTNFSAPTYAEADRAISLSITAAPSSAHPVTSYDLFFDGDEPGLIRIPANAAMPFSLAFDPAEYPTLWKWGVSSWTATARIRAVSSVGAGAGPGPWSDPVSVTIAQSASFFIPDSDWTFAEERDATAAGNAIGRGRVTLSSGRAVPAGFELRRYVGPLSYIADNFSAIHAQATSPVISPGANVLDTTTNAVSSTVRAILLYVDPDRNSWRPASNPKAFVTQGLIVSGTPVCTALPSITGNGQIGTSQAGAAGTWTNSPTFAYQWFRGSTAISGATSANYTYVAADDLQSIRLRVTATAGSQSAEAWSDPVTAKYAPPTIANAIADTTFAQESGAARSIDLATWLGGGGGVTITSSGSSAVAVNNAAMALACDISAVIAATNVTVRAENSGGVVEDVFVLTVTATGSALVPAVIGAGGTNTATSATYTNYLADDMILALAFKNNSISLLITVPDLPGFTGQYDWNVISSAAGTAVNEVIAYRRAASNGTDGDLGTWTNASGVRYVTVRNVDWTDPIGAVATAFQAGATNVDHPGLTLETSNSLVIAWAAMATGVTGQAPGLRAGATQLAQNTGGGVKQILMASAAIPAPSWAAAADVEHTVTTTASGNIFAAAVEIRGATAATTVVWPDLIVDSKWTVTEVTDPAEATANGFTGESGHLKLVTASDIPVSATTVSGTFTLIHELRGGIIGAPGNSLPAVTQSMTFRTSGRLNVGDNAYPRLWWKLGTGTTAKYKLAGSKAAFGIVGLDVVTVSAWPNVPTTALNAANAKQLAEWRDTNSGQAGGLGYSGPAAVVLASSAFSGQTTGKVRLLQQLRKAIETNSSGQSLRCPSAQGGYSMQHDTVFAATAALAKITPTVWSELTSTEKGKIDALMYAIAAAGAAVSSDNTPADVRSQNTVGREHYRTKGSNFQVSHPACVVMAGVYFGGLSIINTWLDGLRETNIEARIYTALADYKLMNTAKIWNPTRPAARALSTDQTKRAMTYAEIATSCQDWTCYSNGLSNHEALLIDHLNATYGKMCQSGIDGGRGILLNDGTRLRGKVVQNASLMPYRGPVVNGIEQPDTIGMIWGFDGADAGTDPGFPVIGPRTRSSAAYAIWDHAPALQWFFVAAAAGLINRNSTAIQTLKNRVDVGMSHLKFCCDQGYNDYSHGGSNENNATPFSTAIHGESWGMAYRFSMWTDILKPWLEG